MQLHRGQGLEHMTTTKYSSCCHIKQLRDRSDLLPRCDLFSFCRLFSFEMAVYLMAGFLPRP
jgi:hypothetical protein